MEVSDVAQLLEIVAGAVGHPALTYDVLDGVQAQLKGFLVDKPDLQDPTILNPLDRALKYGTAAQVPGSFTPAPFDLSDYVEPKQEPVAELPPPSEPEEGDATGIPQDETTPIEPTSEESDDAEVLDSAGG